MIADSEKLNAARPKKLLRAEHGKTRDVWREVFSEDSEKYLDYYYANVASQNEIYVTEESGEIASMLHLNPYVVRMGGAKACAHFIVAVATRRQYRNQGRMRAMLCEAVRDLSKRKEPFTFLTPASEEIYVPFGFRTASRRKEVIIHKKSSRDVPLRQKEKLYCRPAKEEDLQEAAKISGSILAGRCMVYADRSVDYFRRCQKEQEAMEGGILLFCRGNQICGYCFTGEEYGPEVWEAAVFPQNGNLSNPFAWEGAERQMINALTEYFSGKLPLKVKGPPLELELPEQAEEKPATMVRILNLPSFVERMSAAEYVSFTLAVRDEIVPENNGTFQFVFTPEKGMATRVRKEGVREISIGELTELFLGTQEKRADSFGKIRTLGPFFFPELA